MLLFSKGFYPYTIVLGILINGLVIWASSLSWLHSVKLKNDEIVVSKFGTSTSINLRNIKAIKTAPYGMKGFWKRIIVVDLEYIDDSLQKMRVRFAPRNEQRLASFIKAIKGYNEFVEIDSSLFS